MLPVVDLNLDTIFATAPPKAQVPNARPCSSTVSMVCWSSSLFIEIEHAFNQDFCLWGSPTSNGEIGNVEAAVVAYVS